MSRFLLAFALLICLDTASAARFMELVERAVERTLAGVSLPDAVGGTVNFKDCATCGISTHRTTDATVFHANGQTLPFPDFLRVVEEIHARPGTAENDAVVTVFLDMNSDRVTRVALRY
jgi:hypothetical protein